MTQSPFSRFTLVVVSAALLLVATPHNGVAHTTSRAVEGAAPVDTPIELVTATGTIFGTLLVPARPVGASEAKPTWPLVIIHAGSGPTDRDGNTPLASGKNDSLKMLATAFAAQGIASLRYDKRGVAKSAAAARAEADLRFDDYVNDLSAWVTKMRADPRFSRIIIAGHSEGSLIGIIAARNAKADAVISIAGISRRASDVLRTQLKPRLPASLWDESERVLRALEAGMTVNDPPAPLQALYRPSVQPYLISWIQKRPTVEIAKLTVPTLIIQGTTDTQVAVSEAEALGRAQPNAELALIRGMNHVLKTVSEDASQNTASYSDPTLPLNSEFASKVIGFVHALASR
jgi:hypothetical protein